MRTPLREPRTNADRLGSMRDRIERNIEYHQQVADHYNQMLEDNEEEKVERSEEQQAAHDKAMEDAKTIAEMHGEAAKMLADAMAPVVAPVIADERENRPVIRRLN